MISVNVVDFITGRRLSINTRGELITGPVEFTTMYPVEVNVVNTSFNIIPPVPNKQFVITLLDLYADKNVGPSDATVEIYEAISTTSTTVRTSIYKKQMPKYRDINIPVNIMVNVGVYLNIKTDDDIIFANIGGYYVDADNTGI